MAARVNKTLVTLLVIGLILIAAGVMTLAVMVKMRGPERYMQMGDEAKAAGNWSAAAELYEKAVGKDPTNLICIDLWIDALLHVVPKDQTEAQDNIGWLWKLLRTRTDIQTTNADFHIEWLDFLFENGRGGSSLSRYNELADQADRMLQLVPTSDPKIYLGNRYRGLANAVRMQSGGMTLDQRQAVYNDLTIALENNLNDSDANDARMTWFITQADILHNEGQPQESTSTIEQGVQIVTDYAEAHSDDAVAQLTLARMTRILSARESANRKADPEQLRPILDTLEQLCLTTEVPWDAAMQSVGEIALMDQDNGLQRAEAIIEATLKHDPDHPLLLYQRAAYLKRMGEVDLANEAFQDIIDHPNLPTGTRSTMLFRDRIEAVSEQFDLALAKWGATDPSDTEARDAAMAEVEGRKQLFFGLTNENEPRRHYLEGQIARANNRLDKAISKFNQYLEETGGSDIQVLMLMAETLSDIGQTGAALDRWNQVNNLTGGRFNPALRELITIEVKQNQLDTASGHVEQMLVNEPDNAWALQMQDRIRTLQGAEGGGAVDSVLKAITEANQIIQESNDLESALAVLVQEQENHPDDPRLLLRLAMLERQLDNTDEALIYIQHGLQIDPTHKRMLLMQASLLDEDIRPVIDQIVQADSQLGQTDRLLERARLYRAWGYPDEADALYQQALDSDPNHPHVVEVEFIKLISQAQQAVDQQDTAGAEEFFKQAEQKAVLAAEHNLDQAEGLTYFGRIQLARGQYDAAIGSLSQATSQVPWNSAIWRYLAIAYRDSGRYSDALNAFAESLKQRREDIVTLREYAELQRLVADHTGALATIRQAWQIAPNDPDVVQSYLDLEGRYGNRALAIEMRQRLFNRHPDNLENALSLIDLLSLPNQPGQLTSNPDRAKQVLDQLEPADDFQRLRITEAEALWLTRSGDFDAAQQAYVDFIEAEPANDVLVRAYISFGGYQMAIGREEEGVQSFLTARTHQDPVRHEADQALGTYYIRQGNAAKALEYLQPALDANPESRSLSIRVIDLYLSLATESSESDGSALDDILNEAETRLNTYLTQFGADVETELLAAAIEERRGQTQAAEQRYEEAAKKYPNDWRLYRQRAHFHLSQYIKTGNPAIPNRVRQDVQQAIELNPNDIASLLTQLQLAQNLKDPNTGRRRPDLDEISTVSRRILDIRPEYDAIRMDLINLNIMRNDYGVAASLAREALQRTPNSPIWHTILGRTMRLRGDQLEEYALHYDQAFQLDPSPASLAAWVEVMLFADPPAGRSEQSLTRWRQHNVSLVLTRYDEQANLVENDLPLLILKARGLGLNNQTDEALQLMADVHNQIQAIENWADQVNLSSLWYTHVNQMVSPTDLGTYIASIAGNQPSFLDRLSVARLICGAGQDAALYNLSTDEAAALRQDGIQRLVDVQQSLDEAMRSTDGEDYIPLAISCGQLLGAMHYSAENWEGAVEAWRWVLEVDPGNMESENNTAYVLAEKLNRPEEALVPAQSAYQKNPENPVVLDTYGYVLYANGQYAEAERVLRQSVAISSQIGPRIHLAQVLIAQQRYDDARTELNLARNDAVTFNQSKEIEKIDTLLEQIP